jgi:long-chain acyl-CoA synthetase
MNVVELGEQTWERVGDFSPALFFEGRQYSSGELRQMSLNLAGALVELGVAPGDRVAVMTPNCPEVGTTYFACWRIGGVTVPILFLLAQAEVEHILTNSEPKVVVVADMQLAVVQQSIAAMASPPKIVVIGEAPPGTYSIDQLIANGPAHPEIVPRAADDLAGINYTSGTTGRPKGVMLTHGGMTFISNSAMETGDHEDGKIGLGTLPLAHGYGILTALIGMRLQGTGVMMRWFDPGEALRLIQEYRIQLTAVVPTMLVYLLNHPDLDKYDVSSLERVGCGAAPCPVELMDAFEKRFGCTIFEGWGLTESTIVACSQRRSKPKVVGSVGEPWPGITVKVLDDDRNEVPVGELGELCISGPNVSPGYYKNPEATAEAFRDGWCLSGDIGRQDEQGYFYVVERKKDMIIRGGFNIYPRDLEEVLFEHPAIAEAAVVGRPDPEFGEEVVAFVVKRAGVDVTAEEIMEFCRQKLAKYKTPKEVHFVSDLPKNQVGKVLRKELRAQLTAIPTGS